MQNCYYVKLTSNKNTVTVIRNIPKTTNYPKTYGKDNIIGSHNGKNKEAINVLFRAVASGGKQHLTSSTQIPIPLFSMLYLIVFSDQKFIPEHINR